MPAFPLRRVSLKRLLVNLLDNALRYGGQNVEVVTSLAGDDSAPYVVLSVLDRGAGIDPQELSSIFNPFIRGDKARGGKGTGLGLAIVKRTVDYLGGSISVESRLDAGSTFRVTTARAPMIAPSPMVTPCRITAS